MIVQNFKELENESNHYYNKGTKYYHSKNYLKAEQFLKKSLKLIPTREGYLNLGATYKSMNRVQDALVAFEKSTKVDPTYAEAWNNIGLIYHILNKEEQADAMFKKAIECKWDYADAHWNLGLSLLKRACAGQFELFPSGWEHYEYRFLKSGAVSMSMPTGMRWTGQSGEGKTLLVMFEQGIGDNIMFARYLPYLEKEFSRVIVQVTDNLKCVFKGVETSLTSNVDADYWVPVCSLGAYFNIIPYAPYIYHSESRLDGGIGYIWKGNPSHGNDSNRSRKRGEFKRFSKFGKLVSLQYGESDVPIESFEDTMAYINGLDFLVTIDTSVVHLAGAMGKKVFCLLPAIDSDFRWGLTGNENIWYPSVTLIRNMNFDECEKRIAEYIASDEFIRLRNNKLQHRESGV